MNEATAHPRRPTLAMALLLAGCAGGPTVESAPPRELQTRPQAPTAVAAPSRDELPRSARLYDEVLAIVGTDVVTKSSIRGALEVATQSRLADLHRIEPAAKLDADVVAALERGLVQRKVQEYLLADHVDTLGIEKERLDRYVDDRIAAVIKQKEQEAGGSSIDLLRRLKEQGKTYAQFVEETRARIRREIVLSTELQKAQGTSPLLATPQDLLLYYREHLDEFRIPEEADLVVLHFDVAEGKPTPRERAAAARARLQKGEDAAGVAAALAADLERLTLRRTSKRPPAFEAFAFGGDKTAGRVSEPILGATTEVLLLLSGAHRAERTRPFKDEEVQNEIRGRISELRWQEAIRKIDREERRRMQVWPTDLFRH